jgi:hypothetical protein
MSHLDAVDSLIAHSVSSIIIHAIEICRITSIERFGLESFLLTFMDADDSYALQNFLIEDRLDRISSQLGAIVSGKVKERRLYYIQQICDSLDIPVGFEEKSFVEQSNFGVIEGRLRQKSSAFLNNSKRVEEGRQKISTAVVNNFLKKEALLGGLSQEAIEESTSKQLSVTSLKGMRMLTGTRGTKWASIERFVGRIGDSIFRGRAVFRESKGEFVMTATHFFFVDEEGLAKNIEISHSEIAFIFTRSDGFNIVTIGRKHIFLFMAEQDISKLRDHASKIEADPIDRRCSPFIRSLRGITNSIISKVPAWELYRSSMILDQFMRFEISCLEYIMDLNLLSGRSFANVDAYPGFPLVLNLQAERVDLNESWMFMTEKGKPLTKQSVTKFQKKEIEFEGGDVPVEFYTMAVYFEGLKLPYSMTSGHEFVDLQRRGLESDKANGVIAAWLNDRFGEKSQNRLFSSHIMRKDRPHIFRDDIRADFEDAVTHCHRMAFATANFIYDARIPPIKKIPIQTPIRDIFLASDPPWIVYSSFSNSILYVLNGTEVRQLVLKDSFFSAVALTANLLVVACTDFSIRVHDLATLFMVQSTRAHRCPIISLAADNESGVIVSVDSRGCMIFELLFRKKFLRMIAVEVSVHPPLLALFDLGYLAVVSTKGGLTNVNLFSLNGAIVGNISLEGEVKAIDQTVPSEHGFVNFLMVSLVGEKVKVIGIPSLKQMYTISIGPPPGIFCAMHDSPCLYFVDNLSLLMVQY